MTTLMSDLVVTVDVISTKKDHEFVEHPTRAQMVVCRKCACNWPVYGDLCPMPVCPESLYRFR